MAVFDDANRGGEDQCGGREDGFRMAVAEGGAAAEPVAELFIQRLVRDLGVAENWRGEEAGGEDGCAMGAQTVAKKWDMR